MIKTIIAFITILAVWLFSGLDWLGEIFTPHNLANIALVILGIFVASAASQLRLVLEKIENILSLYAKYTHPDSEEGQKLSETERQRLLDLFLRELQSMLQYYRSGIFSRVGEVVQKMAKSIGL